MSQLINASIDLTLLYEMAQKGHSSIRRSDKNQHVYANMSIWVNDEPDQYGNHASISLNSAKDHKDKDKAINPKGKDNCYIGSGKKAERKEPEPLKQGEAGFGNFFGAPSNNQQSQQGGTGNPWDGSQPNTGLPF